MCFYPPPPKLYPGGHYTLYSLLEAIYIKYIPSCVLTLRPNCPAELKWLATHHLRHHLPHVLFDQLTWYLLSVWYCVALLRLLCPLDVLQQPLEVARQLVLHIQRRAGRQLILTLLDGRRPSCPKAPAPPRRFRRQLLLLLLLAAGCCCWCAAAAEPLQGAAVGCAQCGPDVVVVEDQEDDALPVWGRERGM